MLAARERELTDEQVVTETQRSDLERQRQELEERARAHAEYDEQLTAARDVLEQQERALQTHAAALEERRQELLRLRSALSARERALEAREWELRRAGDGRDHRPRVEGRAPPPSFAEGIEALRRRTGSRS